MLVLSVFGCLWGINLCKITLVPVWIGPVAAFIGGALGLALYMLWVNSRGHERSLWWSVCIFLFSASAAFTLLFSINFFTASPLESEPVKVRVLDKSHYITYVSNRVGRRGYSSGRRPVDNYEVKVLMPDGRERTLRIRGKRYKDFYTDREYNVTLLKGCFGMKILDAERFDLIGPDPRKLRRSRPCRSVYSTSH